MSWAVNRVYRASTDWFARGATRDLCPLERAIVDALESVTDRTLFEFGSKHVVHASLRRTGEVRVLVSNPLMDYAPVSFGCDMIVPARIATEPQSGSSEVNTRARAVANVLEWQYRRAYPWPFELPKTKSEILVMMKDPAKLEYSRCHEGYVVFLEDVSLDDEGQLRRGMDAPYMEKLVTLNHEIAPDSEWLPDYFIRS